MEYLTSTEDGEEAWETKMSTTTSNITVPSDSSISSSTDDIIPEKIAPKPSRRHSSIIMKHGLQQFQESFQELDNSPQSIVPEPKEDEFLQLSIKTLKELIRYQTRDCSPDELRKIERIMSTIKDKSDMRELCRKYVQENEIQMLLTKISQQTTATATPTEGSTSNQIPAVEVPRSHQPPTEYSPSPLFHDQFQLLSTLKIKKILLKLSQEQSSEEIQRGVATAVEREELLTLCKKYITKEEEFQRLKSLIDPPPPIESIPDPPTTEEPHVQDKASEENCNDEEQEEEEEEEEEEVPSDEKVSNNRKSQRQIVFRSMLAVTALDDGTSLRGMLHKKSRHSLFSKWNERFWILNYSLLTLRYYKISSTTARSINLDASLPPEETLKGEFSIHGCKVHPLTHDLSGKDHSFQLVLQDSTVLVLATQSEEDRNLWIERLSDATNHRARTVSDIRKKINNPRASTSQNQNQSNSHRSSRHSIQMNRKSGNAKTEHN